VFGLRPAGPFERKSFLSLDLEETQSRQILRRRHFPIKIYRSTQKRKGITGALAGSGAPESQ
jgi:hypothetical protein